MNLNDPIYIAGHTGLIGSAIKRRLEADGFQKILTVPHAELDLTNEFNVNNFFEINRPKYVFLAAGRVGGIVENQNYPADFITANLAIQLNVLSAAHRYHVEKLVFFGSSCMYPRECFQPMSEGHLFSGIPEQTSIAYATAKLAGVQMCLAFNKQFGVQRFIPVIPNSVYGVNDNFNLKSGHVLSVLIRRFHEANLEKVPQITLWGTGAPRREFIYVDDVVDAVIWLLANVSDDISLPINIGTGLDYSIKELADLISNVVGYNGEILWDSSKPDGAPRKLLNSDRIAELGWRPKISLIKGLYYTYEWYLENGK